MGVTTRGSRKTRRKSAGTWCWKRTEGGRTTYLLGRLSRRDTRKTEEFRHSNAWPRPHKKQGNADR